MSIRVFFVLLFSVLFCTEAIAGCSSDMECKGNRICEQGVCVDPPQGFVMTPQVAAPAPGPAIDPGLISSGRRAAIAGWVMTGVSAVAGSASAAFAVGDNDLWPLSLGLGSLALISAAVGIPVSSRRGVRLRSLTRAAGGRTHGVGMRVASWILFGLAMAEGSVLVAMGAMEEIPVALIAATVATGVASGLLMSADTWLATKDARAANVKQTAQLGRQRVIVLPSLGIGPKSASFGIVGRF